MAQDLHDGKIKTSDLNESFVNQTYQQLRDGAATGYAKDFNIVDNKGIPNPRIAKMQQNLYKFSAAKNAGMLQDINSRLYDGNRLRSLEELKGELDKLNIQYDKNWLEAEYRTARQSGHMAQQWEAYQHNTNLFPNLKYKTQEDNKVRPEHQQLDNIIAPIDSPFWDKYYPPNGWHCRCFTVQTAEPATRDIPENSPDVKPEFEINVGKSGQVFNENTQTGHKFFALAKETPGWEKRFEMSKQQGPYETHKTGKDNNFKVSIYADDADLKKNYVAANLAADHTDTQLSINPHINLNDYKNPEFTDNNGIRGDRISPKWKNVQTATGNAFKDKLSKKNNGQLSEEKNTFLAIETNFEPSKENMSKFIKQSWSKFNHYKTVDYLLLYHNDKMIKVERNIIKDGFDFYAKTVEKFLNK